MHRFLLIALFVLSTNIALAWQPTRPVTVIFPNGPGAGNEISFRIVSDQIEKATGVRFNSDHRPGADGNIAMNHFANAPADGHTIAVPACQSNWVTADVWYATVAKYNAQDFEPVANIARSPLAFWAHPGSRVDTPADLIREIQEKKRPINFAIGGGGHKLAVEYLTTQLNVENDRVETIMYKGPAQALMDVMGGHVEFSVTPVAVGWPHVQAGRLKLIGVANGHVIKGLEKYPLMNRTVPGLDIHGCWNLVLPKHTPEDVQKWYREHFVPAIRSQAAQEKFVENMMFITPGEHSPEGVRASMTRLKQTWQPIARKIDPNR